MNEVKVAALDRAITTRQSHDSPTTIVAAAVTYEAYLNGNDAPGQDA